MRLYDSLQEVWDTVSKKWPDNRIPEHTEANQILLEDGLFWAGVELCRFTYTRAELDEAISYFKGIEAEWEKTDKLINENKALRLLLDCAVDCGFGFDNLTDDFTKYLDEIKPDELSYTEGLIHVAKRVVEGRNK